MIYLAYDAKYEAVVDYLNDNFAYFCTHVLNLGKPEYTNAIPTAAVALTSDDGDKFINFSFIFNPDFLDNIGGVPQQSFIFAHETMHILLDHLRLAGNFVDFKGMKQLEKKKEAGTLTESDLAKFLTEQKKMTCFNIAADCVINDWLIKEGFEGIDGICYGKNEVGHDCSTYTVREVYNELLQKFKDQDPTSQGMSIDSHDWLFESSQKEIDAAKKVAEELKASGDLADAPPSTYSSGKNYSLTSSDAMQDFLDQHGVSMEWMKLLQEINPDMLRQIGIGPPKKASFHRHRRKLGAFPELKLPVKRVDPRIEGETDKVPAIVLALDTSGSISSQDRSRFITLARSVPQKKIKLFPITFTTQYRNLDLENPQFSSGGTCFSCIQDYIQKEVVPIVGHYPKAVVVVTDGYADFSYGNQPTAEEFKSWFWLLTKSNSKHYIDQWTKGQDKLIDQFVKNG